MITQPTLLVNVLIVVGEGFWVLSSIAQLRRLIKTRNTKGLSAPSQILNAAGNIAWSTYFALHHLWFPFVTNIIILVLTTAILSFVLSNKKQFTKGVITIALVGPLTSCLILFFPASSGWLGMIYGWMASTPWLWRVVNKRKVSGLSEKGLYFAFGAMFCVLAYAIIIKSAPLVGGCIQGLLYGLIIMVLYYQHRHTD